MYGVEVPGTDGRAGNDEAQSSPPWGAKETTTLYGDSSVIRSIFAILCNVLQWFAKPAEFRKLFPAKSLEAFWLA